MRNSFSNMFKRDIKTNLLNQWWPLIYIGFILPAITDFYETKMSAFMYFMIMIPALIAMFAIFNEIRLPKIMFLCPMSEEMRRDYVEKHCVIRIVVVLLLGATGILLLFLKGMFPLKYCIGAMFNIVVMAFSQRGFVAGEGGVWRCTMNGFVSLLSSFGYVCVMNWDTPVWNGIIWVFVGVAVVIQIPLLLKDLSRWEEAVCRAIDYNRSFVTKEVAK